MSIYSKDSLLRASTDKKKCISLSPLNWVLKGFIYIIAVSYLDNPYIVYITIKYASRYNGMKIATGFGGYFLS